MRLGIYRHTKSGREYRVLFVAKHSETLDDFVIYEAQYQNDISKYWARPVAMFLEQIEIDGTLKPRFEFLRD